MAVFQLTQFQAQLKIVFIVALAKAFKEKPTIEVATHPRVVW